MARFSGVILGLALLAATAFRSVNAIFDDEVNGIDWQLSNIGDYKCVVPASRTTHNDQFVILSDLGDHSLLSWVNKTNGELLDRLPLNYKVEDIMVTEKNEIILQKGDASYFAIDSLNGFDIQYDALGFISSCSPDLSLVQVREGKLKVLDSDKEYVVYHRQLPENFSGIKYFENREDGSFDLITSTSDGKYQFLELDNSNITKEWERDESLANINAFAFVSSKDPLTSKIFSEISKEESMSVLDAYKFRISQTSQRLKDYLQERKFSIGTIFKEFFQEDDDLTKLHRDINFGLLKYLIVATDKGKIVNLDVRNGKQLWSVETGLKDIYRMEASMLDSELFVVTKSGLSMLLEISAIEKEPFILKRSKQLDVELAEPFDNGNFLYVKSKDGAKSVINNRVTSGDEEIYFLDHDDKRLSASFLKNSTIEDTWNVELSEDEEIRAFSYRDQSPVVSLGNILGNRTVLYKYLYPHLAAFATVDKSSNSLTVRIIDTVTGELVHTVLHENKVALASPINVVFGENWCIYTYFSIEPVPEQKIGVIELYESPTPNERLSETSLEADAISHADKPHIIQNAYIYPEVIKNLALTQTKFGITIRSVILELENGQIAYLPKFILNARRVEESKMTADDKKEFMFSPYASSIPINDHTILTHHKRVLSGPNSYLASVPTNLESTSIVCSLGHDLYCTRISPSSQFDKLKPRFQKGNLLSTILGLLVTCFFVRPMVDTKKLKTKWLVKD
ncbi:LANO_0G00914g1_1 [Lachancea nothofagi CBS 11611]|uniref:ER membrane protein complex subunit 1 n=1 Tax=Lachancea nothofagi CBS 11611 TaxID=1266666 RepID=A0A1G4KEL5_9SACH|nr:LANO_0G00914g1_1 [Lachancea nothofagi CBS 11611]